RISRAIACDYGAGLWRAARTWVAAIWAGAREGSGAGGVCGGASGEKGGAATQACVQRMTLQAFGLAIELFLIRLLWTRALDLGHNVIHGQLPEQFLTIFGVIAIAQRKLVEEPRRIHNADLLAKQVNGGTS